MSLVTVGSIALDDISSPAGKVQEALGGSAVYASLAARYFCKPHIVGVVGKDYPEHALAMLREKGVILDGLEVKEGKTFRWGGVYNSWNKAETIFTDLNVFAEFSPKLPVSCTSCNSLLLANIHPLLQLQVLEQTTSYCHVACDTMNYWIGLCPDELTRVISKVNLVFMNEDELKDYTGSSDIFSGARKVLSLGPEWLIVKRGEYGSVAISQKDMFFAPAYPVANVIDPTGAGDTFAGAMMGYLTKHKQLNAACIKEAIRYAVVLSALNVQDFSVNGLLTPSREEIENLKNNLINWTT